MRSSDIQGRFSVEYEAKSLYEGIAEDLGGTVGTEVAWYSWSPDYLAVHYTDVVDDTYDVSSYSDGKGRQWVNPFNFPVVMAQLLRSTNIMNERGFYVTDTLRLVMGVGEVQRLLPTLLSDPSSHIKDRIVYRDEVFTPTRVLPRGAFGSRYAVVTIDCNQVNSEELVNDPQFQSYASPSVAGLRGYGSNLYGSGNYGES